MKNKTVPRLSVFQTFKTKDREFTGEAMRQRGIVMHLAMETLPTRKHVQLLHINLQKKMTPLGKTSIQEYSEISMRYFFH